jgi:8-amino-7-oxononanoate synthase
LRAISKLENYYTIIDSKTAIQGIIIPGNQEVMQVSQMLYENGFDVRGIRFPTVEKGTERLRVCLHSFNGEDEIEKLVQLLLKSKK